MRYIGFNIKNYKGIQNIELDLTKKPSTNIFTLVGLNESGKTTILEAINRFAIDIAKDEAYTLIPKNKQYGFSDSVSIDAKLEITTNELEEIKNLLKNKYKFILSNDIEIIKIEKRYNFENSIPTAEKWLETFWTTNFLGKTKQSKQEKRLYDWKKEAWDEVVKIIKEKFLPKILYYPDFLFQFPEKIYLEKIDGEDRKQDEYRKVLQDILDSIENGLTLEKHLLERMRNEDKSYRESLKQILNKIAEKLNEDILKQWDEIFGNGQKKEVEVSWEKDGQNKFYIEIKIKQGSDSYAINDRSLGFRWFFSFLIFTAFRKSRVSDPGETLFLLDEPASNLHQRSQQKLLESLNSIVSDCKLIYSTHSHHLINPKWLAGTYIVRNEAINYGNPEASDATETKIEAVLYKNFVAKYPNETDHYKPILDALDYIPSKLEVVPLTIFTEGKNDYYTFKYFADVIFKGKYKLHFYPGAGVDKYSDVFRLYLAWNKKFIAIFDSDGGGKKAQENYKKDIGPDVQNTIFILEEIDNSWKNSSTESLFTETEKEKIIKNSFGDDKKEYAYDKSKFNTAIQELYINGQEFNFNKTTKNKFEKIFIFIENKIQSTKD